MFFERISDIVEAIALPEALAILGHELDAANPFGTFPKIQMRNNETKRPAML
ncbi:hypothetical protein D3C84_1206210 [compost metagenome]